MKTAVYALGIIVFVAVSTCGCSDDGIYEPVPIEPDDAGVDVERASSEK